MEKVTKKIMVFLEALKTLEDILGIFNEYKSIYEAHSTEKNKQFFLIVRDAMIQRFEYCTDLIWKVFRVYLEEIEKVEVEVFSPRGVVREAVTTRLLSEIEGKDLMRMVDSRNKTSYIYYEEMASDIAKKIPEYYLIMKNIIDRMNAVIDKKSI